MTLQFKKASSVTEVRETFASIEDNGEDWFTNLLVNDDELARWIDKGQVSIAATPTTAMLLRQRYDCKRLYFANTKRENLAKDLRESLLDAPAQIITTILERNGENTPIKETLREAGFFHYSLLKYAMKLNTPEPPITDDIIFAKEADMPAIDAIIKENFDSLLDQTPDQDELLNAIQQRRVLVMHSAADNQIAAFISFERKGKTLWARYMATLKKYRKHAPYAAFLYFQLLALHADAQRVVGWIRADNTISRGMHQALGFQCDGLATEEYFLYSPLNKPE